MCKKAHSNHQVMTCNCGGCGRHPCPICDGGLKVCEVCCKQDEKLAEPCTPFVSKGDTDSKEVRDNRPKKKPWDERGWHPDQDGHG